MFAALLPTNRQNLVPTTRVAEQHGAEGWGKGGGGEARTTRRVSATKACVCGGEEGVVMMCVRGGGGGEGTIESLCNCERREVESERAGEAP